AQAVPGNVTPAQVERDHRDAGRLQACADVAAPAQRYHAHPKAGGIEVGREPVEHGLGATEFETARDDNQTDRCRSIVDGHSHAVSLPVMHPVPWRAVARRLAGQAAVMRRIERNASTRNPPISMTKAAASAVPAAIAAPASSPAIPPRSWPASQAPVAATAATAAARRHKGANRGSANTGRPSRALSTVARASAAALA